MNSNKAVSMPVNIVIILVVAVLVLLVVVAFFMGGFLPTKGSVDDQAAWQRGCNTWRMQGCDSSTDPNTITIEDYSGGNLCEACRKVFGSSAECTYADPPVAGKIYCYKKCCEFLGG